MKNGLIIITTFVVYCTYSPRKTEYSPLPARLDTPDSSQVESLQSQKSYKTLGWIKYRNQVKYLFNSDSTYVLCVNKQKFESLTHKQLAPLRFFVYNMKSNEIVFEDTLENGQVLWENKFRIRVTTTPETVKIFESNETGYLFDVLTGKKQRVQRK